MSVLGVEEVTQEFCGFGKGLQLRQRHFYSDTGLVTIL